MIEMTDDLIEDLLLSNSKVFRKLMRQKIQSYLDQKKRDQKQQQQQEQAKRKHDAVQSQLNGTNTQSEQPKSKVPKIEKP